MFGKIVLGIDGELFEHALQKIKHSAQCKLDTELNAENMAAVCQVFKRLCAPRRRRFSTDPYQQLEEAIKAVFRSWNGDGHKPIGAARKYRTISALPLM